jgi:hypothetical protein
MKTSLCLRPGNLLFRAKHLLSGANRAIVALGVSRYDPDPLAAIEAAEKKRAAAQEDTRASHTAS